jgi:uncharacterized protein YqeY
LTSITDQIASDVKTAMKAGDRERVGALRLLLSELQKDAKEGAGTSRRSCGGSASAAGTPSSSTGTPIGTSSPPTRPSRRSSSRPTLPQQLSDEELDALVRDAIAATGALSPREMGKVIGQVKGAAGGRADGGRIAARVKEVLAA